MKTVTITIPAAEAGKILERMPIREIPETVNEIVRVLTPAEVGKLLESVCTPVR
jgi:hypothetical protein